METRFVLTPITARVICEKIFYKSMKQRLQNLNDSLHPPLCIVDEVLLLHGHPAAGGAVAAAVLHGCWCACSYYNNADGGKVTRLVLLHMTKALESTPNRTDNPRCIFHFRGWAVAVLRIIQRVCSLQEGSSPPDNIEFCLKKDRYLKTWTMLKILFLLYIS